MCKKTEGVTCTAKDIVDEMWKQWRVKGGKERSEENSDDEEEASLVKTDTKQKGKKKDPKKKETCTCNHCQKKGHIEANCWQKYPSKRPEKFAKKKDAKTEKAVAAVEEEHLLSLVDVEYEYDNDKGVICFDMMKHSLQPQSWKVRHLYKLNLDSRKKTLRMKKSRNTQVRLGPRCKL